MTKVYFRVDAYPEIGTGHLMRCLALANALSIKGIATCFVGRVDDQILNNRISQSGHELVGLGQEVSVSKWATSLAPSATDWIVLDGYTFGVEDHIAIKRTGASLLVIDDGNTLGSYHCDAVLNQNFYAKDLSYVCAPGAQLLLGPRYALLRDEFIKISVSRERRSATRLLVSLGGADPHGVGVLVMEALSLIGSLTLDVLFLTGSSGTHLVQIEGAALRARKSGHKIDVQIFTDNMPGAMAWADIGVIGAGTTSLEVAYMGLPCLAIILADNQIKVANAMQEAGIAESLGWYENITPQSIADSIVALCSDAPRRDVMTSFSRKIVDGAGAQRVVEMMLGY